MLRLLCGRALPRDCLRLSTSPVSGVDWSSDREILAVNLKSERKAYYIDLREPAAGGERYLNLCEASGGRKSRMIVGLPEVPRLAKGLRAAMEGEVVELALASETVKIEKVDAMDKGADFDIKIAKNKGMIFLAGKQLPIIMATLETVGSV
jgi:hypothetical protein